MERKEHTMRLHSITKSESDENLNTLINCDICQNLSCEISLKKKIKKKIITAKQNNAIKTIYYHLAQKLSDIHVGKAGIQCVIVTILKQVCLYLWYMYIYLSHKILHISL